MRRHELRQSEPVHHPSGDRRHLRRRHLDALDRHRGRHGDLGEGRQRLRRRGGDRLHPAGGRAASERPGRRRAGHRLRRAARQAGSDLRPGPGAGRRDDRALSRAWVSTSSPAPACSPPACPAPSRPGCCCCATTARSRSPRCSRPRSTMRERPSAARARQRHHRHGRASCSASIGRRRPRSICRTARRRRPGTCSPTNSSPRLIVRILEEAESAGGDRVGADRTRAQNLVAGLRRRSDRPLLPHPGGDGLSAARGTAACSPPTTWRAGAADRSAADLRLRPLHGVQDRPLEPGAGDAAAAGAAQGFRSRRARSGRAGVHPPRRSSAPSSPSRTAKPSTAIPISSTVPIATLLSDAYNAARRKLVGRARFARTAPRDRSKALVRSYSPDRAPAQPGRRAAAAAGAGEPTVGELGGVRGDTVHFDIVDRPATWSRRRPRAAGCNPRR